MSTVLDIVLIFGAAVVIVALIGAARDRADLGPCPCQHCRGIRSRR